MQKHLDVSFIMQLVVVGRLTTQSTNALLGIGGEFEFSNIL